MPYDLLIRGGTVLDGTGTPGVQADVAVNAGRIVAVGRVSGVARETLDADGAVVCPGFIDNHTHYDAQVCWDPWLTPSCWHGVTTAVLGNCGLGIAPVTASARPVAIEDLVSIEGMPVQALQAGIAWDWESFPEYVASVRRRQPAINVGFYAPLTPMRHFVLGEESIERASRPDEIERIKALLREALDAGALGFSTSRLPLDIGYKGKPVASRLADDDELAAYAGVLRERNRGVIQLSLLSEVGVITDAEHALVERLLQASGRPLTWLALLSRADRPEAGPAVLERCHDQYLRGSRPSVAVRPMILAFQLKGNPLLMGALATMQRAFNRDVPAQIEVYRDTDFRAALREEMALPGLVPWNWDAITVGSVHNPALARHLGRTVAEVARERGQHPVEALLDLAIEDRLELSYNLPLFNTDDALCAQLFRDPRTLVSLSDGGAHADMLCDAGFSTYLLGHFVRERGLIGLEHAVQLLTGAQADFFGIPDRGRIAPGMAADLVVFDPQRVGSPLRPEPVDDFPGGCRRLVTRPTGIAHVVVNGQRILDGTDPTGARPGQVVRN